jgi:general secretion pathway protein H
MTLIEVMVALAIAALLTAAAVPSIDRSLDRARANSSARELVASLRATRQAARASGVDALFVLDVATGVYRLPGGSERALSVADDSTLGLLTAESERLTETAGAIRFFPDGSSTGGTITLTHRDRALRVEIDWLTGHVRAVSL